MDDYALYADTSAIYGQDSTYIYDANLNKQWFHFQKDVYCFKTMSETEYGGSFSSCVTIWIIGMKLQELNLMKYILNLRQQC